MVSRRTEYVHARSGEEVPPEDGYSWRKYGQKHILGTKYPREYYRCARRRLSNCGATKMVQKSETEPSVFEITYGESHSCGQENKNQNEELLLALPTKETQLRTEVGISGRKTSECYAPEMVSTPNNSFNNSSTGVVSSNSNSLFNITNADFITTPTSSPCPDRNFSLDNTSFSAALYGEGPQNDWNLSFDYLWGPASVNDVPENASGTYRGVRKHHTGKWVAEIPRSNHSTPIWLGTFDNPHDAAMAYDAEAYKLYGENAKLNFPHLYNKWHQNSRPRKMLGDNHSI